MARCSPCTKDNRTTCLCNSEKPQHLLHEASSLFNELCKTNHKQKQRLQETPKTPLYLCPPELPWLTWQKSLLAYDLPQRAWQDSRHLMAVCHSALQVTDSCSFPCGKPLAGILQALVCPLSLRKIHNLKSERVSYTAGTGQCPAASQWQWFCSLSYFAWPQRLWSVAFYIPCSLHCHHGNVCINVNFNSHYTPSSSNPPSVPQSPLICSSHKATYLLLFSDTSAVDTKGKWQELFFSWAWEGFFLFFCFFFFFSFMLYCCYITKCHIQNQWQSLQER